MIRRGYGFIKNTNRILLYGLLIVIAFLQLFPFLWVLNYSLSKSGDLFGTEFIKIPNPPQWGNYIRSWVDGKIPLYLANSFVVVGSVVIISAVCAFFISYGCIRMKWPGRKIIYGLVLAGLMVPIHATLLPNFIWFKKLGIINSYLGLIIPYVAFNLSFNTIIFTGIIINIPKSMEEAAYMEGAGLFTILWQIIAPMCNSAFITVGIMTFFNCWNEFIMANTFISKESLKTIPFSVLRFQGQYAADYATQFACLVLVAVVPLILYFIGSKWIVAGVTEGALKE